MNSEEKLEEICKIANAYKIAPKKAMQIYDDTLLKKYVSSPEEAMEITKRYVNMHYSKKSKLSDIQFDMKDCARYIG
jgi:hypothetical protein